MKLLGIIQYVHARKRKSNADRDAVNVVMPLRLISKKKVTMEYIRSYLDEFDNHSFSVPC